MQRRIIGLDLGIATDHTTVVLDETGVQLARRRVQPKVASLVAFATSPWPMRRRARWWRWCSN